MGIHNSPGLKQSIKFRTQTSNRQLLTNQTRSSLNRDLAFDEDDQQSFLSRKSSSNTVKYSILNRKKKVNKVQRV